MKALRYLGSRKLEVQELPVPEPAKGEVLIKVMACAYAEVMYMVI